MLQEEGGDLMCSFNQTVSESTLPEISKVFEWAKQYPDIVHSIVYILYREPAMTPQFDNFVNGKKIKMPYDDTVWGGGKILKAQDAVDMIRTVEPEFTPSAYLNGSVDPDSFKWLLFLRFAQGKNSLGYATASFMEVVQHFSHFFRNRWLSYSSPTMASTGRLALTFFSIWDKKLRKIVAKYFFSNLITPWNFFKKIHMQAFMIIQPVDFLEDGRQNMCDGCPDMTVYKGKLYWSCRLEEIKEHGTFISTYPKDTVSEISTKDEKIPTSEEVSRYH